LQICSWYCRQAIRAIIRNTERGALLTTHYMAEAEAVCDRVAIMVSGKLRWVPIQDHTWPLKCMAGTGRDHYRKPKLLHLAITVMTLEQYWQQTKGLEHCPIWLFSPFWYDHVLLWPPGVLAPSNTWKANLAKTTCWRWKWRPLHIWGPSTQRSWGFSPRLLGRKGKDGSWFCSHTNCQLHLFVIIWEGNLKDYSLDIAGNKLEKRYQQ
jgi:hypothetical protein